MPCSPSAHWIAPSFRVELTLSSPCSSSDPSLSRQGAALVHHYSLPTHNFVVWTIMALSI